MFAIMLALGTALSGQSDSVQPSDGSLVPVVEAEEEVYHFEPANNGAGPTWCHGSTCLVRIGDNVLASGIETLKDVPPLNNCRWTLWKRTANGWELQQADPHGRTREPSPMVGFPDGRLLLSVNPTLLEDLTVRGGPARPEILLFSAADPQAPFQTLLPDWQGKPAFAEHSYRSFAADGPRGEMILFQNVNYDYSAWAFCNKDGHWAPAGKLTWPWGAEYPTPQAIRVCYPNVALKNRAVHFCGVSDIVEPYPDWKTYKQQITGHEWDYDFRRLFYAWSDDITSGNFHPWIELASRDATCGWITPGDLWVDEQGAAHIVWHEKAIDPRLREKFFPDAKQRYQINYAVVHGGTVLTRHTLVETGEGISNEVLGRPRFQVTPDGRLFVFYYVGGADANGQSVNEHRVIELRGNGTIAGSARKVPMTHPLGDYFTAAVRAGSPPSIHLELLGNRIDDPQMMSYARIRLW